MITDPRHEIGARGSAWRLSLIKRRHYERIVAPQLDAAWADVCVGDADGASPSCGSSSTLRLKMTRSLNR